MFPDALLQHAMELCGADTAGLSLLETTADGQQRFRWTNLAGTLRTHVGESIPRDFSPCGVCLDRQAPQLFRYPARCYPYLNDVYIAIINIIIKKIIKIYEQKIETI
jgi:hypothetical protein